MAAPLTLSAATGRPQAQPRATVQRGRRDSDLAGVIGRRPLSGALALGLTLGLAACDGRPIESARTGNPDVSADLIGRIDGCNLYRVRDGSNRAVYVATCRDGATRSSWTEGCGKGCTRTVESLSVRPAEGRD